MPKEGDKVMAPGGEAVVVTCRPLENKAVVTLKDGPRCEWDISELTDSQDDPKKT